jgi:phage N-6-adenine-methyltransferase
MSESDERATPLELFKLLDDEFHFELDVCATKENAKCAHFYTKEDKLLIQKWAPSRCFMNPPYSNIPRWLGPG